MNHIRGVTLIDLLGSNGLGIDPRAVRIHEQNGVFTADGDGHSMLRLSLEHQGYPRLRR
jgi:hypothetical protein